MPKSVAVSKATVAGMLAVVLGFSTPAAATPFVNTNTNYYEISGSSAKELRKQMKRTGPKGYWAYTTWRVRWTSNCVLSVTLNYTYPKLSNPNKVPLPVRKRFQSMLENLVAHEEGHGQNGIDAAAEIKAANCNGARQIIKKYSAKDKSYDRETQHGYLEGVRLDN